VNRSRRQYRESETSEYLNIWEDDSEKDNVCVLGAERMQYEQAWRWSRRERLGFTSMESGVLSLGITGQLS
jgi:hypothetical protein